MLQQEQKQSQSFGGDTIGINPVRPGTIGPELLDCELPLERIYACEANTPLLPLFTQPIEGRTLDWTWGSAMQEVRSMAAWLQAQGWAPGSRIVILSKNCSWWIMADFAIWMAGYVSVPLFPSARDLSLAALFRHSQPVACFVGQLDQPVPQFADGDLQPLSYIVFPNCAPAHIPSRGILWSEIIANQQPLQGNPVRKPDDVATIIYTSGTTGEPKGVMHCFRALSLMGKSIQPAIGACPEGRDRMLSYLPLGHIVERALVEMNVLFTPLHLFFSEGLPTFLTDLGRSHSTLFFSIPRLYIRFQQGVFDKIHRRRLNLLLAIPFIGGLVRRKVVRNLGLGDARLVTSGGAATPVEIIQWYRKLGVNFVEGYGMTETGITHVPLPGQARLGYVGSASPWALTRISPDGEVQIKGPMNMLGYYRNPELTREVFTEDGFFRTGDRGQIDELGRLRLIGRLKEEFKTAKGKYVAPAQIEKLLAISYLFESVAVFGSGMTGPFVMAVLAPLIRKEMQQEDNRVKSKAEMESRLLADLDRVNAQLEHHERLRFIVISEQPWTVDNEMLTPTLKVRRAVLEKRFASRFNAWEQSERKVIWLETL